MSYLVTAFTKARYYYQSYRRLDFTNKSASLSFYTITSIVPLMLFVLAFMEYFVPREAIQRETMRMIAQFFPLQSKMIVSNLNSIFEKKKTFGWLGGIGLLFGARLIYLNLERIVNELLHTDRRRHFLMTRLFFLVWLVGTMAVLFTPLVMGSLRKALLYFGWNFPAIVGSRSVFILSAFLMFLLVVTLLPAARIHPKRIVLGGLLFSTALGLGQFGFRTFAARNLVQYNVIYGSLSSLVLGALWIFYFYQMFLLCIFWTGLDVRREGKLTQASLNTAESSGSSAPADKRST